MLSQIAKITDDQNPDRAKVIEGKIIGDFSFFERLFISCGHVVRDFESEAKTR